MAFTDFKAEFEKEFGTALTLRQLWLLTKFAKNVRLRCRNNKAFNNFMNATFPYARFAQVPKTKQDGTRYEGLSISINGQELEDLPPTSDDE